MLFFRNTLQFSKTQSYVRLFTTEPQTWLPKKRVSRLTMDKIRALNASQPEIFNTVKLSEEFKLSVEAIRRILKSKYRPSPEDAERQEKNRYEAMGQRRKQFQNDNSHAYEDTKKPIKEPSSISQRKTVKDTWRNENITRGGWKSTDSEWKDNVNNSWNKTERRNGSEDFNDRRQYDKRGVNTFRSRENETRDRNSGWRNNGDNQKEWRERQNRNRDFDNRRQSNTREAGTFRSHNNNGDNRDLGWRNNNDNYDNQWRERRDRNYASDLNERKRYSMREGDAFRSRDTNNRGSGWRNNNNNQKEWSGRQPDDDKWNDRKRSNSYKGYDRPRENSWHNKGDRRQD